MSGSPLRVMVADVGADVVLLMLDGSPVLVLRPEQSFESAVTQVCGVCPELHPDAARRLVREHLPHAVEMSAVDDFILQATPPPTSPAVLHAGRRRRGLRVAGVATSAFLVASAGLAVVVGEQLDSNEMLPSALAAGAFDGAMFDAWADTGTMMCTATAALTAHCTDEDGLAMTSEAAVGPTSVLYTFSYGRERLALRIFATASEAEAFAAGATAPPPNLRVVNRFVMWGSDAQRIDVYADSIVQANSRSDALSATQGTSYVLSARLGRLVAGTAVSHRQPPVDEDTMAALENVVAGKSLTEPTARPTSRTAAPRSTAPTAAPPARGERSTPPAELPTMTSAPEATSAAPATPSVTASAAASESPQPSVSATGTPSPTTAEPAPPAPSVTATPSESAPAPSPTVPFPATT